MRIVTAREQAEMLLPWRQAADGANAYDPGMNPNVMKPMFDPSSEGPWYHTTTHPFVPGDKIKPRSVPSAWQKTYDEDGTPTRPDWVWMENQPGKWKTSPDSKFFEVKPSEGPYPWNGDGAEGWVSPEVEVSRELSYDEVKRLQQEHRERRRTR